MSEKGKTLTMTSPPHPYSDRPYLPPPRINTFIVPYHYFRSLSARISVPSFPLPFNFQRLPLEVRFLIYEWLFFDIQNTILRNVQARFPGQTPRAVAVYRQPINRPIPWAILATNKTIYKEAISFFQAMIQVVTFTTPFVRERNFTVTTQAFTRLSPGSSLLSTLRQITIVWGIRGESTDTRRRADYQWGAKLFTALGTCANQINLHLIVIPSCILVGGFDEVMQLPNISDLYMSTAEDSQAEITYIRQRHPELHNFWLRERHYLFLVVYQKIGRRMCSPYSSTQLAHLLQLEAKTELVKRVFDANKD